MTTPELAKRFGVSGATVLGRPHKARTAIRPRGSVFVKRLTAEKLRSLYLERGWTMKQIADARGRSIGTVYRLLRPHALSKRRR